MSILIQNATVIAMDEEHGANPFPADVLVDGEVVLHDRKLTRIDETAVLAEIALRAPEYVAQRDQWVAVAREYEPHMKALYMHCMEQDIGLDRLAAGAHGKRVGA